MKIWVDADACPQDVKEILYRTAERRGIPVCLVANTQLRVPHIAGLSAIQVPGGADVADKYIASEMAAGDLVVTADIPLAARVVEKNGVAIDPRGEVYTEENVGERLSMRDFMQDLRGGGLVQGGPAPISTSDRHNFAAALDREITKRKPTG